MALKAIVASLDAVPLDQQDLYRDGTAEEGAEGLFVLDVDGAQGWSLENIGGLKSALDKERARADAAEKDRRALGDLSRFDPDQEADQRAERKLDIARTRLEAKHGQELAGLKEKHDRLAGELKRLHVDRAVGEALSAEGVAPAMRPLVEAFLRQRLTVVEGSEGAVSVQVLDETGAPNTQPSTPRDLVRSLREQKDFASCFLAPGAPAGGSGYAPQAYGPTGPRRIPLSDQDRMNGDLEGIASGDTVVF